MVEDFGDGSPLVIAAIQRRSETHFEQFLGRSLPITQGVDTKHPLHQHGEAVAVERERAPNQALNGLDRCGAEER
jgi:hypothetical protein